MPGFYVEGLGPHLRRGDVVVGFPVSTPSLESEDAVGRAADWKIIAQQPKHLVVLTPCCSIEDKSILLAPLTKINEPKLLSVPWLVEDFTRINQMLPLHQALAPDHYARLPMAERAAREAKGPAYPFTQLFCYAPHPLLAPYQSRGLNISHWQVNFTDMFKLQWKHINRNAAVPPGTKVLELTIEARDNLRMKLAYFFNRRADEDGPIPL